MAADHDMFDDWAEAFGKAAWLLQAGRDDGADGQVLEVEACDAHGPECACVIYGGVVEHFRWADHDPGVLAEELLYPVGSRPGECKRRG
jgi:hypothetical protein